MKKEAFGIPAGLESAVASHRLSRMKSLKVRVINGKLVGDAPAGLPEGTELELCVAAPDEELSEQELAELNAGLEAAWKSVQAGRIRPACEVVAELAGDGK